MIGHHAVDRAIEQPGPQQLAVGVIADRRAALELRRAVGHVFSAQGEVMRAGLGGDRESLILGRSDQWQRRGAGQVHDVGAASRAPGLGQQRLDGGDLSRRWPRRHEVGVAPPTRSRRSVDDRWVLGVREEQPTEPGNRGHRVGQLSRFERGELLDARGQQEALEADHARLMQHTELTRVSWYRAAPERDVHRELSTRGDLLGA